MVVTERIASMNGATSCGFMSPAMSLMPMMCAPAASMLAASSL